VWALPGSPAAVRGKEAAMIDSSTKSKAFDSAELGALAHLYRAEVYRSTVWRTRLDNTTNWAVVTTGIALSVSFGNADTSPLPLIIVGLLVIVFLLFEGRRYRYFHLYRARARLMETGIYRPILDRHGAQAGGWSDVLSRNYRDVKIQISIARAVGRRLRRNYAWILIVQAIAYYLKLIIHPVPMTSLGEFLDRAAIGPISGAVTIGAGMIFHISWLIFAVATLRHDQLDWNRRSSNGGGRGG
jgi:uncharacterized membrane protein